MKRIRMKIQSEDCRRTKRRCLRILFVFKIISLISPTETVISIHSSGVFSIFVDFISSIATSFSVHRWRSCTQSSTQRILWNFINQFFFSSWIFHFDSDISNPMISPPKGAPNPPRWKMSIYIGRDSHICICVCAVWISTHRRRQKLINFPKESIEKNYFAYCT